MYKTIIILLLFIHSLTLNSQTVISTKFKRYTFEAFALNNINKLDIRAKHAEINLLNWDKDSISVETNIEILSDKPNLSEEMLEEVKINVVGYENTLQVKTSYIKDFNRTIPYTIKYTIFYPDSLALRIENEHGKVNVGNVLGGTYANISHCDIFFKGLNPINDSIENHIVLNQCNGKINQVGNTHLQVKNSVIEILKAEHIQVQSSYNQLQINQCESFNGHSEVDLISISNIDSVEINSQNSILSIGNFTKKAKLNCTGGSVDILNSSVDFNELTISNHQTKTQIQLNPSCSYILNGEVINGKLIHNSGNNLEIFTENLNQSFSGDVGFNPDTKSKVIIFNRDENIIFK